MFMESKIYSELKRYPMSAFLDLQPGDLSNVEYVEYAFGRIVPAYMRTVTARLRVSRAVKLASYRPTVLLLKVIDGCYEYMDAETGEWKRRQVRNEYFVVVQNSFYEYWGEYVIIYYRYQILPCGQNERKAVSTFMLQVLKTDITSILLT